MTAKESTLERKYALRKIGKSDWLLPANDVETSGRFWRLSTYEEGPSHGVEDMPRDRLFWGVWEWDNTLPFRQFCERLADNPYLDGDPLDWQNWSMWGGCFESRREAIEAALRQR